MMPRIKVMLVLPLLHCAGQTNNIEDSLILTVFGKRTIHGRTSPLLLFSLNPRHTLPEHDPALSDAENDPGETKHIVPRRTTAFLAIIE
jgi:hypothetical protein